MNINICEYQNYINKDGDPKGHGKKSFEEAYELLIPFYPDLRVISSKTYFDLCSRRRVVLDNIEREGGKKIKRFLMLIHNLRSVARNIKRQDVVWFTNVDWFFFFYLGISNFDCRMLVTIYNDVYERFMDGRFFWIRKFIGLFVKRGFSKVDVALITPPKLHCNYYRKQIHIPDFYYDSKYDAYRLMEKENIVSCIGLMHKNKDIMGVISHFRNSDIKVIIAGDFDDENLFILAKACATNNIFIENRRLSDKEYYDLMGKSKFVILPYKKEQYRFATSGILLETAFVNSIPIAPDFLLSNNNIKGIGYKSIDELPRSIELLNNMASRINNDIGKYKKKNVSKKIVKVINDIFDE